MKKNEKLLKQIQKLIKKDKIEKYESGVNQVAKSTNSMAVERRLHQQNGTWGSLSSIPLVGGVMSNSLNYLQGKGRSEYDRNTEIANMKMDRLAGQAQNLQEGFRTQGMRNSITNSQFGNQDMNDLYANMNNKAKHGKKGVEGKDKALIEVEKDELIFRPTRNGYKLVADLVGGRTHEQGGEPIVAKEGDVIFPGKQRKQVASLLDSSGSVADLSTFETLRAKLPKDKPSDVQKGQNMAKSTGGRIEGTGMDVREAFRQGCYAKKYEEGVNGLSIEDADKQINKLKSELLVHKAKKDSYKIYETTSKIKELENLKAKILEVKNVKPLEPDEVEKIKPNRREYGNSKKEKTYLKEDNNKRKKPYSKNDKLEKIEYTSEQDGIDDYSKRKIKEAIYKAKQEKLQYQKDYNKAIDIEKNRIPDRAVPKQVTERILMNTVKNKQLLLKEPPPIKLLKEYTPTRAMYSGEQMEDIRSNKELLDYKERQGLKAERKAIALSEKHKDKPVIRKPLESPYGYDPTKRKPLESPYGYDPTKIKPLTSPYSNLSKSKNSGLTPAQMEEISLKSGQEYDNIQKALKAKQTQEKVSTFKKALSYAKNNKGKIGVGGALGLAKTALKGSLVLGSSLLAAEIAMGGQNIKRYLEKGDYEKAGEEGKKVSKKALELVYPVGAAEEAGATMDRSMERPQNIIAKMTPSQLRTYESIPKEDNYRRDEYLKFVDKTPEARKKEVESIVSKWKKESAPTNTRSTITTSSKPKPANKPYTSNAIKDMEERKAKLAELSREYNERNKRLAEANKTTKPKTAEKKSLPRNSGLLETELDSLRNELLIINEDKIKYKNDPKALAQLKKEEAKIKADLDESGDSYTSDSVKGWSQPPSYRDTADIAKWKKEQSLKSLKGKPYITPGEEHRKTSSILNIENPFGLSKSSIVNKEEKKTQPTQSSPSSYVPTPRYSEHHTTGVKRGGVQLEPTNAQNAIYNPEGKKTDSGRNSGDYDAYKYAKVQELRDKGVDISDYEGNNDLETFYNLYYDKKHSAEKKKIIADKKAIDLWKQISTEGAKPSITKPKPMEVDENSKPPRIYQDEELPEWNPKKNIPEGKQYDPRKDKPSVIQNLPDKVEMRPGETPEQYFERRTREDRNNAKKLKHGTKSLKEYSKGSYGIEHEEKEVKNFKAIQKKLNILKGMHKGIPKAEQGMQSVFGVQTGLGPNSGTSNAVTPSNTTNMYQPTGVGTNSQGSLQTTAKPVRNTSMMQGVTPMTPSYGGSPLNAHVVRPQHIAQQQQGVLQGITPTMPSLSEPKGAGTPNTAKGILGQMIKSRGRGFGIKGWDSGGFNLAVGQSRARGDAYTDKYTGRAGSSMTNQYERGSKKLVVKKYGWGTGFVEANKAEESRKKKEDDKQYRYINTDMNSFTKSMELSDKIIDRNLKLREKGEKKYEKGSYYLKTRSRVGKGSNKYNSTHVEQALANEGKNLNEDEKNYIRKFYKDRNYDVAQDPARLIDMYRYAGSNFKGGFDEYKSEFLKQKGHTLPYKTREEYVEDYVDNYGDKNYALHSSNRKDSHKQFSPRDWNNSDVDNLGWELGTMINNTTANYQPAGPASTVTGPGSSTKDVVPVKETVNTESVKDRPIPTTVKDPTRINFGGERGASLPTNSGGDNIGGLLGGDIRDDRRIRRNKATAAGTNRNKIKGGGGDSMEIEGGGGRGASAPANSSGDNIGGAGAMIPFTKKNGEVGFKAVKGGKIKSDRRITGNKADASGVNANKIKLGPGGPQDPNTMSPAQLRGANAGVDQAMLGANADARAKEEAARQANAAGLTKLGTIEEKYAKLQGKEKEDYDKFYTEEEARRKSQYDTDKEELRNKLKAGANYDDAQFEANHPKYEPMTKGAFMPGSITGVDTTRQALNSAQVGNTAPLTGIPGSAATWQSPAELRRAMMAGTTGGGQGNSYIGGVPQGGTGGQGNSQVASEEKENNVTQISNPVAIGGNNDNDRSKNITKKSKFRVKGGMYPEDVEALKALIAAKTAEHEATMRDRSNRSADRRDIAISRHASDTAAVQATNSQAPIIQGSSNTRINSDNTNEEEFRRGSRRLVVRKYEEGNSSVATPKKKNNIFQKIGGFVRGGKNNNDESENINEGFDYKVNNRQRRRQENKTERARIKADKEVKLKEQKPQNLDFKPPRWKETKEKYDPAVSADDVIANKTKLYRNNYQDLSAGKRQDVNSLMSGGGFDSGNQIANKVNKQQALDQINTAEAGRLDQVNQANTQILNQEKMTNFGAMNEALNAQAQNKGVADSMNYSALLRNNERYNNKEMKDMNLNMARMQYSMAQPMMAMQMENQRLANEYMKNWGKTPGSPDLTPATLGGTTPSTTPPTTPYNPFPGTSLGGSKVTGGADMVPEAKDIGKVNPMNTYYGPQDPSKDPGNFLRQAGIVFKKGTRKLRVKRDSNISKVPLR